MDHSVIDEVACQSKKPNFLVIKEIKRRTPNPFRAPSHFGRVPHETRAIIIVFQVRQVPVPECLLWFLNNNGILYREDGSKRLADNTLVALTLMIAESKTEEKDVMVKVVVNLINQKN